MAVEGADPDAGVLGDGVKRRVKTTLGERAHRRGEQQFTVASGVRAKGSIAGACHQFCPVLGPGVERVDTGGFPVGWRSSEDPPLRSYRRAAKAPRGQDNRDPRTRITTHQTGPEALRTTVSALLHSTGRRRTALGRVARDAHELNLRM